MHLTSGNELLKSGPPDPDSALTNPHSRKLAAVDHVPDCLLVQPQRVGDLGDGQELVRHRLNLTEPNGRRFSAVLAPARIRSDQRARELPRVKLDREPQPCRTARLG